MVRQSTVNAPSGGSSPSFPANTKTIGDLSEAMVFAALLRAGKVVLHPFGDNQRYDLVIDEKGIFKRVQVKTGRIIRGAISFPTCSSYAHRKRPSKDYKGQIELFGVYVPKMDKVYLVPVNVVGTRCALLRLEKPKNCQSKNIRWAKDYELII